MLKNYGEDVTCVAFMGGDREPHEVDSLAAWMKKTYPTLKTAWYSGRTKLSPEIHLENFNFIKLGPYIENMGPLNKPTTNQRLYKVIQKDLSLKDITSKFWKK